MKYMKEERLDIGRQIFEREITIQQAQEEYGITERTATRYRDLYKAKYGLTENFRPRSGEQLKKPSSTRCKVSKIKVLTEYERMSREELIQELAISKINEARAKKGYMVKGVGSEKEYIPLSKQSTK